MSRPGRRSSLVAALAATVMVGGTLATSGVSASVRQHAVRRVAAASSVTFVNLRTSELTIKNSHGRTLHLQVGADGPPGDSPNGSVTLSTGPAFARGETHSWNFTLKPSEFTYSAGHGKLTTGTTLKSFGKITLTFAKTSQRTSKCNPGTGTVTTIKGTVRGTVYFNTNTGRHGWGTVGSKTKRLTFKAPNFVTELGTGCPLGSGGGSAACVSGVVWTPPFVNGSTASFFGTETKTGTHTVSTLTLNNTAQIAKPAGARRTDFLMANLPSPTLHSGTLSITTSGHGFSGSASIAGGSPNPNPYPCGAGSKKKTEHPTTYSGSWTSHALTGHFTAIPAIKAPASGGAGNYTIESFS